ncbi:peptide chain release factor 3, partial [Klebsiella oxytoca]
DEIEKELGITTCPVNWPIGSGKRFKGVYDRHGNHVLTFSDTQKGTREGETTIIPMDDEALLLANIGDEALSTLRDEIELL